MIGAANVNGKVANKKELQGYVTVPNKVVWDKEKIAEIEQAAQDKVNAAEAKAAQDIAAAAAENEKALAAKDKECEAKIEEVKAQSDERVDNAINETIQGDYNYCEFVREEPISDTDSSLCGYYRFYNDKITIVQGYAFASHSLYNLLGNYWGRKEESDKYDSRVYVTVDLPNCEMILDNAFLEQRIVSELKLPKCKRINNSAFKAASGGKIEKIDLPECIRIEDKAFYYQPISEINLPKCIYINDAFNDRAEITKVYLPAMTDVSERMFSECPNLESALFDNENITTFGGSAYYDAPFYYPSYTSAKNCNLKHIIIPKCTTVLKLGSVDGLVGDNATAKAKVTIYVPRAMVEQYKAATNWSAFNIAAIEDNRAELQGIFTELDELEGWS